MKFEDHLKKAFSQEPLDWDKEDLWGEIEKTLPPKKKKRKFFFLWFFTGVALLVMGALLWPSFFGSHVDSPAYSSMEAKSDTELKSKDANTDINTNKLVQEKKSEKGQTAEQTKKENTRTNEALTSASTTSTNTKEQSTERISTERKALIEATTSFGSNNMITSQQIHSSHTPTAHQDQAIAKQAVASKILADEQKESVVQAQHTLVLSSIRQLDLILSSLPILDREEKTMSIAFSPFQREAPNVEVNKIPKSTIALNFFVGNTMKSNPPKLIDWTTFKLEHDKAQNVKESIGAGIMYKRAFKNNFSLGIGLQYRRQFEWYQVSTVELNEQTVQSDSAFYFTYQGQTQYLAGEKIVVSQTTTDYKSPVRRHHLDMPVELGYHWNIGKLHLYNYVQGRLNLVHQYRGRSLDQQMQLLTVDENKESNLFRKMGVHSVAVGLDLIRPINKRLFWSGGIYYLRNVSNSFDPSVFGKEYFSSAGLKTSLIYRW